MTTNNQETTTSKLFTVRHDDPDYYGNRHYIVSLPHQCDEWMITESRDKDQAIKELKEFIAEANEALQELEELK